MNKDELAMHNAKEIIIVRQKSCGTKVAIQRRWFHPEHYEKIDKVEAPVATSGLAIAEGITLGVVAGESVTTTASSDTGGSFYCGPCGKPYKTMPALKTHRTKAHKPVDTKE